MLYSCTRMATAVVRADLRRLEITLLTYLVHLKVCDYGNQGDETS